MIQAVAPSELVYFWSAEQKSYLLLGYLLDHLPDNLQEVARDQRVSPCLVESLKIVSHKPRYRACHLHDENCRVTSKFSSGVEDTINWFTSDLSMVVL